MSSQHQNDSTNLSPRRLTNLLRRLNACDEAAAWAKGRDGEEAWNECPDGSWLLWIAARIGVDRRLIVRAAAACAETALQFVPSGEDRPRLAIEAARAWADDPSEENRQRAREADAASYAADAADAAASASYAADAASYAADAAANVANAASYAADAAASASYAADAASYAADAAANVADAAYAYANAARREARAEALQRCAVIVREHIPLAAVLAATAPSRAAGSGEGEP